MRYYILIFLLFIFNLLNIKFAKANSVELNISNLEIDKYLTKNFYSGKYQTMEEIKENYKKRNSIPKKVRTGHWSGLPIWSEEAVEKGYEIEPPFVIAANYMDQSQYINPVENSTKYHNLKTEDVMTIKVLGVFEASGGIALKEDGSPDIEVKMGKTKEHTKTKGVRLGFWLFPFMQVYGIYNEVSGYSASHEISRTKIDMGSGFANNIGDGKGLGASSSIQKLIKEEVEKITGEGTYKGKRIVEIEDDVIIDLNAKSYGGGITVAGGYKKLFSMVDMNYSYSKLDFSDDYTKTFVISTRIGYNGKLFEKPFRAWIGGMGQYVSSKMTGKMSALRFKGQTNSLMKPATLPNSTFEVRQNLAKPINFIIGARYTFTKYTSLMIETGFAGDSGRSNTLINFEILF